MLQRCNNPKCTQYRWYGGKGISVCERWKIFANFHADMGDRPEGYSIDRIDGNGNYEPGNCRWADAVTQRRNRQYVKMTYEKACALRAEHVHGEYGKGTRALAAKHGISRTQTGRIIHNESWVSPDAATVA